jgi:hypothetical protein
VSQQTPPLTANSGDATNRSSSATSDDKGASTATTTDDNVLTEFVSTMSAGRLPTYALALISIAALCCVICLLYVFAMACAKPAEKSRDELYVKGGRLSSSILNDFVFV